MIILTNIHRFDYQSDNITELIYIKRLVVYFMSKIDDFMYLFIDFLSPIDIFCLWS